MFQNVLQTIQSTSEASEAGPPAPISTGIWKEGLIELESLTVVDESEIKNFFRKKFINKFPSYASNISAKSGRSTWAWPLAQLPIFTLWPLLFCLAWDSCFCLQQSAALNTYRTSEQPAWEKQTPCINAVYPSLGWNVFCKHLREIKKNHSLSEKINWF